MPKKRKKPRVDSPRSKRPQAGSPLRSPRPASSSTVPELGRDLLVAERSSSETKQRPAEAPAKGPLPSDEPLEFVGVPLRTVQDVDPQALGITYRFELQPHPPTPAFRLNVRGRHLDPQLGPGPHTFTAVHDVPATTGRGPAAVTIRATDVASGLWEVVVEPTLLESDLGPSEWAPPRASGQGRTGFAPVVRSLAPGVVIGAWPALVLLGVVVGSLVLTRTAAHLGLPAGRILALAVASSVLGAVGGKGYFLALHRDRQSPGLWQTGLAIQGFVITALTSMAVGSALLSLPTARVLDLSVAGMLVGLAIGRIGCLFGGCCAGRPTPSRWGVWSSDRSLGLRRIPTQLLESASAAVLAVPAVAILWNDAGHTGGLVAVAGLGAYTAARQLLFPLRATPRTTRYGRMLILMATSFAAAAVVVLVIKQG